MNEEQKVSNEEVVDGAEKPVDGTEQTVEEGKKESGEADSNQDAENAGEEKPGEEQDKDGDTDEEDEKPADSKRKPSRWQKRVDKLTRDLYELRGQNEALQNMIAGRGTNQDSQNTDNTNKPVRENYGDDGSYIEALTDWKLEQRFAKQEQERHKERQAQQKQTWQAKEDAAISEYQDYHEVIEDADDVPVNKATVEAIFNSDYGPDIRYYLAKNKDEAARLYNMPANEVYKHIGRIEGKIETAKAARKAKPANVSKAPAPIKPIKASGGDKGHVDLNDPKVPVDVWMKQRNAELFKR